MKLKNTALKILATCATLFFSLGAISQDSIVIQGELKNNSRFAKVVVNKFGIGSFPIGAFPIKNNAFRITAPLVIQPGVYRFQYSQNSLLEFVDVIIDTQEKEINFSLDLNEPPENRIPVFTQSNQNIKWYNYQVSQKKQLQKISALQNALALYPEESDKIIKQLEKSIALEQKIHFNTFSNFMKENEGNWAAKMVKNNPVFFTDTRQDWRLQDYEKRNHFWDNIDTNQPELINSPLYTEHILEYLKYYMNPEMEFSEEEMNAGFIKSVDTIIEKFSGTTQTKEFAIKYLQLGFKEIGNEKLLQYIDEKYKNIVLQCTDENDNEALKNRLKGYETMKEGVVAPNLFLENDTSLYDSNNDSTIIVFWASWCPHCIEEMPKINEWASKNTATRVIAISLDDNKQEYEAAIANLSSLQHFSDFKKWEGKAVNDYFIHATPTFIMLDKDKKIKSKHADFTNLLKSIQ